MEAEVEPLVEGVKLLAGYSADMEIILDRHENVLRIPSELVVDDSYVLVVDNNSELQRKAITKGLSNWHFTEVLSGLNVGEQLVISIDREGVEADAIAILDNSNSLEK